MIFRRKTKNRRFEREYVLDVKLRSGQVRAARTRAAALGFGGLFVAVFGIYLAWRLGGWALNQLVYENKAFAVEEIDAKTDGVIGEDQLRKWAGVQTGQNLLALDLARVKRDLELIPFIQFVSVERVLPHTLRLRISEREPIAQVNVPRLPAAGGLDYSVFHLDPDGFLMPPLDPRQRAVAPNAQGEPLPIISGLQPDDVQAGKHITTPQLQAALQLIMAFEHSPMVGLADLRRIDLASREVLQVTTGQGSEITFGLTDLEQQLRRWHAIFDYGQKQSKAVASLDLAVTNHIPARWLEASAVPPVAPRLPKPLRNKKKHV